MITLPGGGVVRVRGLSVNDFQSIQMMAQEDDQSGDAALVKISLMGIVEPELTADDIEALGEADLGVITLIGNKIMELSGMLGKGSADAFLQSMKAPKGSSSTASKSSGGGSQAN